MNSILDRVASWEFWAALPISAIFFISFQDVGVNDYVSIVTTFLSILFASSSLSLTIFTSIMPRKFLLYIENKTAAYSTVVSIHIFIFFVYLVAIVVNLLYLGISISCYRQQWLLLCSFMTSYALTYTFDLIAHMSAFLRSKLLFDQMTDEQQDELLNKLLNR